MRTVMWDCPFCRESVPLSACIAGIHEDDEFFDGETKLYRFTHVVCPYCGNEDYLSEVVKE